MNLIEQEVSQERWIRHSGTYPRYSETMESKSADSCLRIGSCTGNTGKNLITKTKVFRLQEATNQILQLPQAWYNKQFGIKKLTTETGAGQWGSALSYACAQLGGIECKVFMVRVSFDQKPFRKMMMETWGGKCIASPSMETQAGRDILAQFP
jgi:tryptophan synthase beta chain